MSLPSSGETKALAFLAKKIEDVYTRVQLNRIDRFLEYVDLRLDSMTEEARIEFNKYLDSEYGQEQLVDFVDSILKTSCKRARMAIALLYCKDDDFDFDPPTVSMIVIAMHGMTDDLLNFFLEACKLRADHHVLYKVAKINYGTAGPITENWDLEAISINVNDLVTRRLFLPDPNLATEPTYGDGNPNNWSIHFGVTKRSKDIARLIEKATFLLGQSTANEAKPVSYEQ